MSVLFFIFLFILALIMMSVAMVVMMEKGVSDDVIVPVMFVVITPLILIGSFFAVGGNITVGATVDEGSTESTTPTTPTEPINGSIITIKNTTNPVVFDTELLNDDDLLSDNLIE